MSLIKLFKIPAKLFKKDVITFIMIRRHDLGVIDNKLRYIAIRPSASVLQIRQKLWYFLDLPDYCEELLILKNEKDQEIPLTDLRKGNDPQHPYVLEVWLPGRQCVTALRMNMLTLSENRSSISDRSEINTPETNVKDIRQQNNMCTKGPTGMGNLLSEYKKSDVSCKISTSTLFFKMHGKKSRDNFANLLLKIQNDLTTLGNKLSNLENRIQI